MKAQSFPSLFRFTDRKFDTEEECLAFIEEIKWHSGFTCRQCGHKKYCRGSRKGDRQCTRCRKIESIKAGTAFQGMRFPLVKAFFMIRMLVTDKKSCPSTLLTKYTGLSQKTAWLFHMKVMHVMKDLLATLEDDVHLVNATIHQLIHQKDGKKNKVMATYVVGVEKKGKGAAKIFARNITRKTISGLKAVTTNYIDTQASLKACAPLKKIISKHQSCHEKIDQSLCSRVSRVMRESIYGRYGRVMYLDEYLAEHCYRHNHHLEKENITEKFCYSFIKHRPAPYKLLIGQF